MSPAAVATAYLASYLSLVALGLVIFILSIFVRVSIFHCLGTKEHSFYVQCCPETHFTGKV